MAVLSAIIAGAALATAAVSTAQNVKYNKKAAAQGQIANDMQKRQND